MYNVNESFFGGSFFSIGTPLGSVPVSPHRQQRLHLRTLLGYEGLYIGHTLRYFQPPQTFKVARGKGLVMAWKWIRISLESWMVSWYKNEIVQGGVSNCMHQCLIFWVLKVHIPAYLGSRGKSFFETSKFFQCVCQSRLVQIRVN